ncbi:MAG: O-antigen ligase family protein [Nitrospirae bacterium]|nr:O-antigen ligase family protein [Nitrospirota bacterium]
MAVNEDSRFVWRGLLLLLLWSPIPSGSIAPLAQVLLTGAVFVLLVYLLLRVDFSSNDTANKPFRLILACWILATLFAFFQAVPLPSQMVAALSPSVQSLYSWTIPDYHDDLTWRPLSTTPGATIQTGLLIGACGAVFFLVARLARTRERIHALALTLVLIGMGESLYGLAQVGGSLSRPASGSFVNRNHFAALLAMALCVSVGLLLSRWQVGKEGTDESRAKVQLDQWAQGSPLVIAALTMLAGIVFSFSRIGLVAPLAMLALFGSLWLSGAVPGRIRLLVVGAGVVAVLLMSGAWAALEVTVERFQILEVSDRLAVREGTYRIFQSFPAVGIGLGGLVDNLPRFIPSQSGEVVDHSHNEPLEILAEGGVSYGLLFIVGLMAYWGTLIPAWLGRHDPLARGLGLGCLAGMMAILLHSFVEFPLRMPSNALYLSSLMGLGWTVIQRRSASYASESSHSYPCGVSFIRMVVLIGALIGVGLSAVAGVADLLDRAGDNFIIRTSRAVGEEREALLAESLVMYNRSVTIEPWQPSHAYRLGRAYEINAVSASPFSTSSQIFWASAAQAYGQAVQSHPANGRLQVAMAWASLQNGDIDRGRRAAQAALKLTPDDQEVQFAVARWYLTEWESLNEEDRRLTASLVQRGASEFPERYVEAVWQSMRSPGQVRSILPGDLRVRRLLLNRLTEQQYFADRWAEQADYPALRSSLPETGVRVMARGQVNSWQEPLGGATSIGPWAGMVEGWLSGGLTASLDLELPPGEVVLYIPIQGEAAGGVWPRLSLTLGGNEILAPTVLGGGWQNSFVFLSTQGGKFSLQAVLGNGAVLLENGRFIERRVRLGAIKILAPGHALRGGSVPFFFWKKAA